MFGEVNINAVWFSGSTEREPQNVVRERERSLGREYLKEQLEVQGEEEEKEIDEIDELNDEEVEVIPVPKWARLPSDTHEYSVRNVVHLLFMME